MSDRDPLMNLAGSIDDPVAPDAAFAAGLKSRLLESLAEPEAAGPINLGTARKRSGFSTWLQIAAVLILAIGVTSASIALRHNDPTPTVIPAVQGQATGSSEAAFEVAPIWRALPEGQPNLGGRSNTYLEDLLAINDKRVFRLVWTSEFEGVIAYDASTGAVLWQQEFQHLGSGLVTPGDDLIFVKSKPEAGATITAFDQRTGDELWTTTTNFEAYDLVYAGERLFLWDGVSRLFALDANSGEEVAARRFTRSVRSDVGATVHPGFAGTQLIVVGDAVVIGAMGGLIASVPIENFDTAPLLWTHEMDRAPINIAISDNVIAALTYRYVVSAHGSIDLFSSVTALDFASGEVLWETPDESSYTGFPLTIQGGFAFGYALRHAGTPTSTSDPFVLHGRDARTGDVLWTIDGLLPSASSPDEKALLALRTDLDPPRAQIVSTANGTLSAGFVTTATLDNLSYVIDNERLYTIDDDYALVAYELAAFFED